MQTISFHEYELSRLMLGTVQFGLAYGISNQAGQPTFAQVCEIIAAAHENGINCLDTAPLYGESEEVLGRALAELKLQDEFTIVTKTPHMAETMSSQAAIDECMFESIENSLRKLRLDVLPIVLFHREDNFHYIESLLKARDRGLVKHIGSSINTPEAGLRIAESGQAEALQIPSNILDKRFRRAGVLDSAKQRNIALFVRSVYLQGLLLMPDERVPAYLQSVVPVRHALQRLAQGAGLTMEELCFRHILGMPAVSSIVVGVENAEQLKHNARLTAGGSLPEDLQAKIDEIVPDFPDEILMPNKWADRMQDAKLVQR